MVAVAMPILASPALSDIRTLGFFADRRQLQFTHRFQQVLVVLSRWQLRLQPGRQSLPHLLLLRIGSRHGRWIDLVLVDEISEIRAILQLLLLIIHIAMKRHEDRSDDCFPEHTKRILQ